MSLPAFSRLPVTVDLPLLLQALAAIGEDDWHSHFNSDYYVGDWSGVALISATDALTELSPGRGETLLRAPWLQDIRWQQGLRDLPLQIVCARLLRLGPGGRIHEHRDYDLGEPDADLRLHIPLLSPPQVDFLLDGQRMPMAAGECWFLDLSRPHRVDNHDTQARIHLATTPSPEIGYDAFARFKVLVASDPQLCKSLQGLQDNEAFIVRTLELAAERGLAFTREQLRAAMRDGRRQWNEQWSA